MESFLVAINAVIPFLCYITFGYGAKARGVLEEDFLQKLNKMVFRLLYPFMTFIISIKRMQVCCRGRFC